ncbi:MAG TPA: AAA family ATPase [Actinopolymorphaceae bacterium]
MSQDLAPLYVLTGAPGAGKTTLLPELVRLSRHAGHGVVVMDIDELLDADGALLGVPIAVPDAEALWPTYNRMWRRIIDMPRRVGHPVLFLCPLVPEEFPGATAWALLDCGDRTRAERLRARGEEEAAIAEALDDARAYRALVETVFDGEEEPAIVAERIVRWTLPR